MLDKNVILSTVLQSVYLRSFQNSLTRDAALTLVHAFVSSRVDYCIAIYAGISESVARNAVHPQCGCQACHQDPALRTHHPSITR